MSEHSMWHIRQVFDRRASDYDHLDWVRDPEFLDVLFRAASPQKSDNYLDIATGTGAVIQFIGPWTRVAVGVDLSLLMLRSARSSQSWNVQAAAEYLPFPSASFDLITCRNGLHHFANPKAGIAEMIRVAKPKARIIISESLVPEGSIRYLWRKIMEVKDAGRHPDMYFDSQEFYDYLSSRGLAIESASIYSRRFSLANWLSNGCIEASRHNRIMEMLESFSDAEKRSLKMSCEKGETWLLRRTALVRASCHHINSRQMPIRIAGHSSRISSPSY